MTTSLNFSWKADVPKSLLQHNPRSQILEKGYINIYSELNARERRQLHYKTLYKHDNPIWSETLVFLTEFFKANVSPDSIVLDAGCGNGNYIIDENRGLISWAVGVDTAEENMQKNICLDEKIVADLESLPFPDNHFDAVLSLWVLEHLRNPEKVLSEVLRVLKTGGFFMFATPNKNYLPIMVNELLGNSQLSYLLNDRLYGRGRADIFKTYYRANTLSDINKIIPSNISVEVLRYNYDPSYTSFDSFSYKISGLVERLGFDTWKAHIIGVLKKK